jgi:hypothetical protein
MIATKKKKNLTNKNQGWEPIHQKYKANENTRTQVDTTQREKKSKQSTKIGKDPMQKQLMATK